MLYLRKGSSYYTKHTELGNGPECRSPARVSFSGRIGTLERQLLIYLYFIELLYTCGERVDRFLGNSRVFDIEDKVCSGCPL